MYQSEIIEIKKETHDTNRYFNKIKDVDEFEFKPGQFVSLMLPLNETKKRKGMRHYSIASSPGGNILEFIINKVEGGLGNYLSI